MSDIGTVTLQPSDEYQDLSVLLNTTFTQGKDYIIQVEGDIRFCEKSTKPTKGGFRINFNKPFTYEAGSDKLWVKALSNIKNNTIVVAD